MNTSATEYMQVNQEEVVEKSWSEMVQESIPDPEWVTFVMATDGPEVSPTLTAKDIGTLLFKKLGYPPASIEMVDPSGYKKLRVLFKGGFDYSEYFNAEAIVIRDGLKALSQKEIRFEKWIKITRLPPSTEN